MADTATYAGAMRTKYVVSPRTAQKPGDSRPSHGSGGLTPKQRRQAARNKARNRFRGKKATGGRDIAPGPNAIRSVRPV